MKSILLALGLVAGVANAEVIECPSEHRGARLIGASMYEGEQKKYELMGGRKKVAGGVDVDFGFNRGDVKWVACWYEPTTPRWYRVSLAATRCDLREREIMPGKMKAIVRCK